MAVQVYWSGPLATRPRAVATDKGASRPAPGGGRRLRAVGRGIWRFLVNAISGPGLDDAAFPSSFEAPYRRGSRYVRSLWHMPF